MAAIDKIAILAEKLRLCYFYNSGLQNDRHPSMPDSANTGKLPEDSPMVNCVSSISSIVNPVAAHLLHIKLGWFCVRGNWWQKSPGVRSSTLSVLRVEVFGQLFFGQTVVCCLAKIYLETNCTSTFFRVFVV